jgi:hypothetical protein
MLQDLPSAADKLAAVPPAADKLAAVPSAADKLAADGRNTLPH